MVKAKNRDHVSCLHLALRLRPVFEGAGEPGIFSVPEPRGKIGIFPSPGAYVEETVEQTVFEGEGESGIFPSSRAYVEVERLEFFLVPEPRRKLGIC